MKKIMTFAAVILLTAITALAQDGRSIYNKYSDEKGVSCVYISPAMFRMIGKVPDMDINGNDVNLSSIIKTMSGLYVIDSENPKINSSLIGDVDRFISKGDYEMLMEAKDNGETVRIYTVGDETTVTSFVLLSKEADESTFICLEGKMSRQDLEKAISEATK